MSVAIKLGFVARVKRAVEEYKFAHWGVHERRQRYARTIMHGVFRLGQPFDTVSEKMRMDYHPNLRYLEELLLKTSGILELYGPKGLVVLEQKDCQALTDRCLAIYDRLIVIIGQIQAFIACADEFESHLNVVAKTTLLSDASRGIGGFVERTTAELDQFARESEELRMLGDNARMRYAHL